MAGLDGLRACAIVAVLLLHLEFGLAPGGFVGVDAFFVLSGFLITSQLVASQGLAGRRLSLRGFYARRALRLLPVFGVVVAGTLVAMRLVPGDGVLRARTAASVPYLLGYAENWWRALAPHGSGGLLDQAWSLAVEEQFYLLWPLVVLLLLRRWRPRAAGVAVATAFVGETAVAVWALAVRHWTVARWYDGTDTHSGGLLLGAALALWLADPRTRRVPGALAGRVARWGPAGAGALVVLVVVLRPAQHAWAYWAGIPAAALATAAVVVALVVHPRGVLGRVLAARPLAWLGERSYALYLVHYPLILLSGVVAPAWSKRLEVLPAAQIVLSVVLAACSQRWLERPVMAHKGRFPLVVGRPVTAPAGAGAPAGHAAVVPLEVAAAG